LIEAYVLGRLSLDETKALEDHLASCPECRNRLDEARAYVAAMQLALAEFMASDVSARKNDRRREPRFPCNKTITLRLLEPPYEEFSGTLHDISSSGAGLCTERAVTAETAVAITWSETDLTGTVRHCGESTGKFKVGVLLDRTSPWWPVDLLYDVLVDAGPVAVS
jgi:anti-sigma factor RsiW